MPNSAHPAIHILDLEERIDGFLSELPRTVIQNTSIVPHQMIASPVDDVFVELEEHLVPRSGASAGESDRGSNGSGGYFQDHGSVRMAAILLGT
jgi:hypothetical protein